MTRIFFRLFFVSTVLSFGVRCSAAEWQWSVPMGAGRAFLWIPPGCARVRAVVVGQHNMTEEGILEHAAMRRELARHGFAEVWVAPPFDGVFAFDQGAGERFEEMMRGLAAVSGYGELAFAPVIPIGHSACASYVWNFAAWNPGRTLAILSVHGDAPQTNMTGSGKPNPDWGARNLDGVPGLMVMAEYEWLEGRLAPALAFHEKFPAAPVALLPEPGRGHFDTSEDLVAFLALFIRKAAAARLPVDAPLDRAPVLKPVDPAAGWLVERWHLDGPRKFPAAPAARYTGDPKQAFWCFDAEMARATENYRANQERKRPQLLGWVQEGKTLPQVNAHQQVNLRFLPLEDGLSFRLAATFLDSVDSGSPNPTRWTGLPPGSSLGHATEGGPILLSRITGPFVQTGPDTFRVSFNRASATTDRRSHDLWLLASHPGDERYKSAVQQALLRLPTNNVGAAQHLTFAEIPGQKAGVASLKLSAVSDAGTPVSFFVREGPAEIEGDTLRFTALPPRTKFPVAVTVVAWQFGRSADPKLQAAEPVTRTFLLNR